MHDLNTLKKLNAQAFADAVNRARIEGKTVVAKFSGVTCVGFEAYHDASEAARVLEAFQRDAGPSEHATLLPSLATVNKPVKTLGDYVEVVAARAHG